MKSQCGSQIAFVGASGSGKTTLIEALIPRLRQLGLAVGVVKYTHHQVEWDSPGKDSFRFQAAGASRVILKTPHLFLSEGPASGGPPLDEFLEGLDLVIHEGDRQSEIDKLIVGESLDDAISRGTRGRIVGLIGGLPAPGLACFDRNDVEAVAAFVLQRVRPPEGSAAAFDIQLERSVAAHGHLCPGQVLGVRMAMRGLQELGLSIPPPRKRVIAIVETDRCAADAVASVSGCSLGKRSLKHFDFGKMAASFLDLETGAAVRVAGRDDSREIAGRYATAGEDAHTAQTRAYRLMSDCELLTVQRISLRLPEADLPGRPRNRVACDRCGEHVSDDREVRRQDSILCRPCAGASYYVPL